MAVLKYEEMLPGQLSVGSVTLPMEDSPALLDDYGPVFILGCPRSGTTFLSKCVGSFPNIEEFVGVLAPPRMMHLIGSTTEPTLQEQLLLTVRDTFWNAFWRRRFYRDQRLVQLVRKSIGIREYLQKASLQDALFCYKEPFLCFAAVPFAEHFSRAKFIHIIRDGRDNADSLDRSYVHALSDEVLSSNLLSVNKSSEIGPWSTVDGFNIPWWVPEPLTSSFRSFSKYERNVLMWREMTLRAKAVEAVVGADRYFEIKYEDFVREPARYGRQIGNFLGRPVTPLVEKKLGRAFQGSIGVSKGNQDPAKIRAAEQIAGELLEQLGYGIQERP